MKLLFDDVCATCPLAERRGGISPISPRWHTETSDKSLKYLLIGEAPGKIEVEKGRSFVGPSGILLDQCIDKAGISIGDCLFSNSCLCAPPPDKDSRNTYGNPKEGEWKHCIPHSLNLIRRFKPEIVIAVGGVALNALIPSKGANLKITNQHGKILKMRVALRDRYLIFRSWFDDMGVQDEFLSRHTDDPKEQLEQIKAAKERIKAAKYSEKWIETPVLAIVHTSFALQNSTAKWTEKIQFALQAAFMKVEGRINNRPTKNYWWLNDLDKAIQHLDWLINNFESGRIGPVACDVETSEELGEAKRIGLLSLDPKVRLITIQLSHENNQGVVFMISHRDHDNSFSDPVKFATLRNKFVEFFQKVDIVGQNFQFDSKAIRCRLGIKEFRLVGDTMLMFHWLAAGKNLGLGLDDLGARLLGTGFHKRESREWRSEHPGETLEDMPLDLSLDYAAGDTDVTFQCYHILKKAIEKEGRWEQYYEHHHGVHDVWRVIADLEWYGMPIDEKILDDLDKYYPEIIEGSLDKLHQNPFIRKFLEVKRLEHNSGLEEKNKQIDDYNQSIEPGSKRRKKTRKKLVKDLTEWVENKKRKFNPNSYLQVLRLWKEFIKFPWKEITGIVYSDVKFSFNKKGEVKVGKKPKTDKNNRKILADYCNGRVSAAERLGIKQLFEYWKCVGELLEGIKVYKQLSKNHTSFVRGIYPLIIDKPTHNDPDKPWDPGKRCHEQYSSYHDFPRPWSLHPSYNLAGTETGRISSTDPNGQAFPKYPISAKSNVKLPYVSRWAGEGGIILQPDYSQIEVRVLVMMAKEALMAEAINNGEDVHRFVASLVHNCRTDQVTKEQRDRAKTVTFGIVYGQGIPAMAQILGIKSDETQRIQNRVFAKVPNLKKFIDERHEEVKKTKRVLNPIGRCCYIPEIDSELIGIKNKALRNSVNSPIQGTASDLCAQSFGRTWKRIRDLKIKAVPFNICHDSVTFDAAPGYFFDLIEAQYYEMVWAQYEFYDWLSCKPEIDFDIGAGWGRLVGADLIFDDSGDFDHNRLVLSGEKEDILALTDEIKRGGQKVKVESDGIHPQKEESEKGKWQSRIFVERPNPICFCKNKKLEVITSRTQCTEA